MKLYFAAGACSLAPHIVLRELALPFELVRVDNRSKCTADGRDFRSINPKGYVAALALDDGQVLTEGPAILQFLADLRPQAGLAPSPGLARARLQEWLAYLNSEVHAGCAPLFEASLPAAAHAHFRARLQRRLDYLAGALGDRQHLLGQDFGVADAYLFTLLGWLPRFGIALAQWPALAALQARIGMRAAVRAALAAEAGAAPVP